MSSAPKLPQVTHTLPRVHERELERIERTEAFRRGRLIGDAILRAVYGEDFPAQGDRVASRLTESKRER